MKKELLFISFVFFSLFLFAQDSGPNAHYKLQPGKSFVQSKNYYLLTLIEGDKDVIKLLQTDAGLSILTKHKIADLDSALKQCSANVQCLTLRLKFSETEIKLVSDRLAALYKEDNSLGHLVHTQLIPSGTYIVNTGSPKELLVKAWEQDAHGINYTIDVYGEGAKAHYPNIDSISFNTQDKRYPELVYNTAYTVANESRNNPLFFSHSLNAALTFLEINERNNAADYEPMMSTVNKAAYERVRLINWKNYAYTLILVPGAGPEEATVALSAEGMLRCRLAAIQYQKGLAPFIMVSGGKVHPYKTKYCEAFQMKEYLMQNLKIPEEAIIVEPHARHTTTNMRNCARLIYRYGMPFEKPCLTTTTRYQSNLLSGLFVDRCLKELHEVPYRVGNRLSETELVFFPLKEALQINPEEPMDP